MGAYDFVSANVAFLKGDLSLALQMYLDGAKNADAECAFNYAYCLRNGIGVPMDLASAKSYFLFARDLEGGDACYNLSVMYMHGEGVRKDLRASLRYMSAAAEMGCVEAQMYLGMAYTLGALLEPDIIGICRIPYHKAELRETEHILEGDGSFDEVEEQERLELLRSDPAMAFYWFHTAATADPTYAAQLVAKAQFMYARCYIDGFGTDPNPTYGAKLMLLAGRSGSEDAVRFLTERGVSRDAIFLPEGSSAGKRKGKRS